MKRFAVRLLSSLLLFKVISSVSLSKFNSKIKSCYLSKLFLTKNLYNLHKMSSIDEPNIDENNSGVSKRVELTESPYIEDNKYSSIPGITTMSLGSSYWNPPLEAINQLSFNLTERSFNRYGNIEGENNLKKLLLSELREHEIYTDNMNIMITCGANQAFTNIALCLTDISDNVVLLAPYYFSHKLALQLVNANVIICPFNKSTLLPLWDELTAIFTDYKPKMIVITTPNNPSGLVWSYQDLSSVIDLCKKYNTWLICDQTYHNFLYDQTKHIYPCSKVFDYEKIIHIFSLSKSYGLAGYRVGYLVYPNNLAIHMRKIQDTIPTHTAIISQRLAEYCLLHNKNYQNSSDTSKTWVEKQVDTLIDIRESVWKIVEPLGTIKTYGAFYFLVPVPKLISEEEAVDILAKKYKIMLMLGWPFSAKGYLRLSYGSIFPDQLVDSISRLRNGFNDLMTLSSERKINI